MTRRPGGCEGVFWDQQTPEKKQAAYSTIEIFRAVIRKHIGIGTPHPAPQERQQCSWAGSCDDSTSTRRPRGKGARLYRARRNTTGKGALDAPSGDAYQEQIPSPETGIIGTHGKLL